MSMSINGAMNSQIFRWPEPGGKNFSQMREKVDDVLQNAGKQVLNLQKMQHHLDVVSSDGSAEKLQAMAERLENRIEAVTTHFDEMMARLNKRFEKIESRALEEGKEGRAEHIGKISDRVNSRLDASFERTVARFDKMSERIRTMLSESYVDTSGDVPAPGERGISEIA